MSDVPAKESEAGSAERGPNIALWQWLVICCAVFLIRILPWVISEFWHDEVITLGDFAIGPEGSGPAHVFRAYPVANNHILFSAIAWWWVRFTGFASAEYLLRLPSVFFGVLSVCLVSVSWRRWLGNQLALLLGFTLAISPVFAPFAYQFRGYSLTMLLTIPAVTGLALTTSGSIRRGLWLQLPCLMLLPLVMPSNAMLAGAHALFLFFRSKGERPLSQRFALAAAVAGAGALGLAYYLTIWDQFVAVLRQTSAWGSGLAVVGNVVLGFVAHAGMIGVVSLVAWRRSDQPVQVRDRCWSALYLACLGLMLVVTILAGTGNAPFPRVFLVFLLPASFALARVARHVSVWKRYPLLVWAGLVAIMGFTWERGASMLTGNALEEGRYPQNLLQQYYRGRTDLRSLAARFGAEYGRVPSIVVTNAYDFPSFRFYWIQEGLPADAVSAVNREPSALWESVRSVPGSRLFVVAVNEIEAARMLIQVAGSASFTEVVTRHPSSLYMHVHDP